MLIDWFTVGAQTLNFLILVWLLKRFLYQPVLNAIDAREHRVASDLASARKKEMDAEQARDLFQQKNESFERQRNELLQEAKMAAGAERLRLLSAARLEAEELTGKRKAALQRELQELSTEICARTGQEVLDITRQALNGLAGVSLEIRMTEKLLEQLQQPDAETMRILGGIRSTTDPLTIRSAFPLTIPQQTALQNALNQCIGAEAPVLFASSPDLLSGIELRIDGYKLGWNIRDYLTTFGDHLNELFAATTPMAPHLRDTNEQLP